MKDRLRILVADDDGPIIYRSIGRALSHARSPISADFVVTADGEAAERVLESEGPFDIVIIDWLLPHVSGVELARNVRAGKYERPGGTARITPIMGWSAGMFGDDRFGEEIDVFMEKPPHLAHLIFAIRCLARLEISQPVFAHPPGVFSSSLRSRLGEDDLRQLFGLARECQVVGKPDLFARADDLAARIARSQEMVGALARAARTFPGGIICGHASIAFELGRWMPDKQKLEVMAPHNAENLRRAEEVAIEIRSPEGEERPDVERYQHEGTDILVANVENCIVDVFARTKSRTTDPLGDILADWSKLRRSHLDSLVNHARRHGVEESLLAALEMKPPS